jgi:hypothetical protein
MRGNLPRRKPKPTAVFTPPLPAATPPQPSTLHPKCSHRTPPATPSAQVTSLPMPMTDTTASTGSAASRTARHGGQHGPCGQLCRWWSRRLARHGGRGVRVHRKPRRAACSRRDMSTERADATPPVPEMCPRVPPGQRLSRIGGATMP